MSELKGKVIVITGASSGIGEATAKVLAERGAQVVLGARRSERLVALAAKINAKGAARPASRSSTSPTSPASRPSSASPSRNSAVSMSSSTMPA